MDVNFIDEIGIFIRSYRPPAGMYGNPPHEHTHTNRDELSISQSTIVRYTKNELLELRNTHIGCISNDGIDKIIKHNIRNITLPPTNCIVSVPPTNSVIENGVISSGDFRNEVVEIAKDGNCYFRCLSQFLYNTQEYHEDIRRNVVQTMTNKREYYMNYIDGNFYDHISLMSLSNGNVSSWATEAEIIASCETYDADVFIKDTRRNQEWLRYSIRMECDHNSRYITILYESNHYSLIKNIQRPCRCGSRNPDQTNISSISRKCFKNNFTKPTRNPNNLIKVSTNENDKIEIKPNHPSTKKNMNKQKVSSKGISFMSININGIRGKKNVLAAFLDTNKPDIVAIQETKIDNTITSSEIVPKECNYITYRKDRSDGGGGVMLLIKNNIQQVSLAELDNTSESIWVKIKLDGCFHYIGNWYRSPQGKAQDIENLRSQLEMIRTMHNKEKLPNIHILGDLNYRHISWTNKMHREGRQLYPSEGKTLVNIMDDHSLTQIVNFPTREENTLDLIITTTPDSFEEIYSPYKFSDHSAVKCTLRNSGVSRELGRKRIKKYNQGDYDKIREEATIFAYSKYLNGKENERDINENWSLIESFVNQTVEANIPIKITKQNSLPWVTNRIRRLIKRRDKAHKKSKITGNISIWKKLQAKITKEVKLAREKYLKISLENAKENSKKFWKYIKSIKQEAQHIPALKYNADLKETSKEKANAFNDQFTKIFTKQDFETVPLNIPRIPKMDAINVTSEGVFKLLKISMGTKLQAQMKFILNY